MSQNLEMIASHTMPDFVTPVFQSMLLITLFPLLVSAILGSKLWQQEFRLSKVAGAFCGLLGGLILVSMFLLPIIWVGQRYGNFGAIACGAIACFCSCGGTYWISRKIAGPGCGEVS